MRALAVRERSVCRLKLLRLCLQLLLCYLQLFLQLGMLQQHLGHCFRSEWGRRHPSRAAAPCALLSARRARLARAVAFGRRMRRATLPLRALFMMELRTPRSSGRNGFSSHLFRLDSLLRCTTLGIALLSPLLLSPLSISVVWSRFGHLPCLIPLWRRRFYWLQAICSCDPRPKAVERFRIERFPDRSKRKRHPNRCRYRRDHQSRSTPAIFGGCQCPQYLRPPKETLWKRYMSHSRSLKRCMTAARR